MLNGPSPSPESTTFPRDGNIGPHLAKIPAAILIRTLPPTPKKKPFPDPGSKMSSPSGNLGQTPAHYSSPINDGHV